MEDLPGPMGLVALSSRGFCLCAYDDMAVNGAPRVSHVSFDLTTTPKCLCVCGANKVQDLMGVYLRQVKRDALVSIISRRSPFNYPGPIDLFRRGSGSWQVAGGGEESDSGEYDMSWFTVWTINMAGESGAGHAVLN